MTSVVVHVNESNGETTVLPFKKEERNFISRTEEVATIAAESHDLRLCPAETLQIFSESAEELGEAAIFNHLIDGNPNFWRRLTNSTFCGTVETGFENVAGFEHLARL